MVFINRDLSSLDKNEWSSLSSDSTYFKYLEYNGDLMYCISYTNICIDNSTKCDLFFLLLLIDEKNNLWDQFNNNIVVELGLNVELALILGLLKLFSSWAFDKKSIIRASYTGNENLLLPKFKETKSMIEITLGFLPYFW